VIHKHLLVVVLKPPLAVVSTLLAEHQVNEVTVLFALPLELKLVAREVAEVLLCLSGAGGAQTFVVPE
jgi:hypothetical protein